MFSYIIGIAASTLSPEALLSNKSLTFLDLTNNSIGDDGASELAKAIEQMPMWPTCIRVGGVFANRLIVLQMFEVGADVHVHAARQGAPNCELQVSLHIQ